jgi:hypothetical protein
MNEIRFWVARVGVVGDVFMAFGLQDGRIRPYLASRSEGRGGAERYCNNYARYRRCQADIIHI